MRVSWKWLSELVDLSQVGGPEGLADLLTSRGLEVEGIERQDQGLEKVITAHVVEREQHPQSDRLSLCKVSTGSGEPLQIVCGAANARAGIKVALAQIGAELPNGLKIGLGKIRGVESHGMLCSEEELKLKDKSEGILELPQDTAPGLPIAQVLGRDDVILVLKLTANRGDCMSHYGLAREVAATGLKLTERGLKLRDFSKSGPSFFAENAAKSPIAIHLDAGENAPQFLGVSIDGVKIASSPAWVVKRLESLGSRSINNVVDATNLVMLELGHPMHAYDADRVLGKEIRVRMARAGESLPLLDGQTIHLAGTELVIADGERAVGLAGVMGGGNSEVQDTTTRLFVECAEFHPGLVRKAASKHARRTDAAQRFEKGIDPMGLERAVSRLTQLIIELAGGKVTGAGAVRLPSRTAQGFKKTEIKMRPDFCAKFLGIDSSSSSGASLDPAGLKEIFTRLDCEVREASGEWTIVSPTYRRDLRIAEDLAEEVARTIGYDQIPATIPQLTSDPSFGQSHRGRLSLIQRTQEAMAAAGLRETINFSFSNQAWLEKVGTPSALRLLNPLSEEYEVMVPDLLPGLLRNALDNWNKNFGAAEELPIRLFELRPVFAPATAGQELKAQGEMETGARERLQLGIVLSGPRYAQALKAEQAPVDFYDLKAIVEGWLESIGARGVRLLPMSASRTGGDPLFHPGQSVEILAGKDVAGYFGLLHPAKARDLKVRAPIWMARIDWEIVSKLSRAASESKKFKSWPEYPAIERDFALVVKNDVTSDKITQLALKAGKPLAKVAKVFDIYRGSQVSEGMTSVAVRVIFYEETRSLQEQEAENASRQILEAWKKELGAELRG